MYKLCASIYTGLDDYSLEDNLKYLDLLHEYGYEVIFSSAHINEATLTLDELQKIVDKAYEYGIHLSLDVSKPMMERFVIPKNLYALRLDYGFTKEDIVSYSKAHDFVVELNASTITKERLEELINLGLDTTNVRASFNFYPKLYTGHDIQFVKEKIALFKKYNIPILIFIPSHTMMRPPMYEGLPSIEKHRTMNLDLVIEELKTLDIDEIAFGDAYASKEELETLKIHQVDTLILPFHFVDETKMFKEHLDGIFSSRIDSNNLMLRSTSWRGKEDIQPFNTVERKKGYVTIDNNGFKRYKGEINIILEDLPSDERVNVIGFVELTDDIITALKKGKRFTFGVKTND